MKLDDKLTYKIYQNSSFNLKDTLLWYQSTILSNTFPKMLINYKIVVSLVKNLFLEKYDLKNFETIREKTLNILSLNFEVNHILNIVATVVINHPKIEYDIKQKVIRVISENSLHIPNIDRTVFILEHIFFTIYIYFIKKNNLHKRKNIILSNK